MLESTTILIHDSEFEQLEKALGEKHPIVCRAREALADEDPKEVKYREAASRRQREGEFEVDAGAAVSMGADAGAYVSVWIWVSDEEAGIETEDEEEAA
jgi:hypothetical protein